MSEVPPPIQPPKETSAAFAMEQNSDARMWAMIAHLSALCGSFIPFGNILGPMVVWLCKKDEYPFVDFHGKESLNFQISVTIAAFASAILIIACIGVILLPVVVIGGFVYMIIGAIKANEGEMYEIPYKFKFVN